MPVGISNPPPVVGLLQRPTEVHRRPMGGTGGEAPGYGLTHPVAPPSGVPPSPSVLSSQPSAPPKTIHNPLIQIDGNAKTMIADRRIDCRARIIGRHTVPGDRLQ